MIFLRSFIFGLLTLALPHQLVAQPVGASTPRTPYQVGTTQARGVITYTVTKGDSILERHTVDPNEEVRVIVQFQNPPLSTVHPTRDKRAPLGSSLSTLQSQIASDHARFRSDLARLEVAIVGRKTSVLKAISSRVKAEYQVVLNGVALSTRRWLSDRLRALPYVKGVFPDRPIHIQDSVSNHQIGADSVWAQYGATGDSVKIGVIDTGIDYMHPDLGAGFGPGHKVAGGWDFVNNDPDPADDNGHGTHVAGIISANGPKLKGVAPAATLYAYKVLDAHGWGETSLLLAAIERVVDPDGDPATDDHLDVLNLSLGAPGGDPADPLSQAVKNATEAGVLCVVAAGNNALPQTINSPGCAASALTVGACDSTDNLAYFSSQGPTNFLFTIKPDLVAPGEFITSTVPGGTYQAWSGTSMAAPHAAGAAALLKQLHRDWTPGMLKSALMGSAKDLRLPVWQAGTGRLDVLKAAGIRFLAAPQTLSFGLDHLTEPRWTVTDTVTVYNLTDSTRTFAVGSPAGLPAGFSLTPGALSFTVAPRETIPLSVTLTVDNTVAQVPKTDLEDVTGALRLTSGRDTLRLPWAVVLGTYIDLEIPSSGTTSPYVVFTRLSDSVITANGWYDFSYSAGSWRLRRLLKPGAYEIMVGLSQVDTSQPGHWQFAQAWLARDSVSVNPVTPLTMAESEARYSVGTAFKNEQGAPLDSSLFLLWVARLTSKRTGVALVSDGLPFSLNELQLPDKAGPLSSNFVYDYYFTTKPDDPTFYTYAGQVSPVTSDQVTDIRPGDLQRRDLDYRAHSNNQLMRVVQTLNLSSPNWITSYYAPNLPGLAAPFHQVWYAQGQPLSHYPWYGLLLNYRQWYGSTGTPPFEPEVSSWQLLTPNQALGSDGVLRSSLVRTNTPVQESRTKKVIYGLGPRHYFGRMANAPTILKVKTNTALGMFGDNLGSETLWLPLFLNQAMDYEPDTLRLFLRDSTGRTIDARSSKDWVRLDGNWSDKSLNLTLPKAGRYSLQVWQASSYVSSLKGAATVLLTFDSRLKDNNPPTMTSFNIYGADSEYTDTLMPGEQGRVEFCVGDEESALKAVSLFYHTDSSRTWQSLHLTTQGELYRAQLPLYTLRDRLISLRVLAVDGAGNSLDYQAEPALAIGTDYTYANRAPVPAHPSTPDSGGILQLYSPAKKLTFSWHPSFDYDGWDTLSYTFRIRGGTIDSTFDRWCRDTAITLDLMAALAKDQVYRWWVETSDGHIQVQSDTATLRTSSTVLAAPSEESLLPKEFALGQNYPNPFNPTTRIRYALPLRSHVTLTVYNTLGQQVRQLVNGDIEAGYHEVQFNAGNLASGVYFYRLLAGAYAATKAMLVVK